METVNQSPFSFSQFNEIRMNKLRQKRDSNDVRAWDEAMKVNVKAEGENVEKGCGAMQVVIRLKGAEKR